MTFEEDYLKLLGQVSNLTRVTTGVDVVDAYFGPKNLSPQKAGRTMNPEELLMKLDALCGAAREIDNELRRVAITSDLESMKIVVDWLLGKRISYSHLVEGIFGITPSKYGQKEIRKAQTEVDAECTALPGSSVSQKILGWREKSKISGEALEKMVKTEIVQQTEEMRVAFERQVLSTLGTRVENNGIVYETVTGKPWSAYNYYQGDYRSVNAINTDVSFNRYGLTAALCHEYEHHVSNLFTENYYQKKRALDLSAVLLHTKKSVISEGTANCAREFLGLHWPEFGKLLESLNYLQSIANLNVAHMLNVENADENTAAEYLASEAFLPIEDAKKGIRFTKPLTADGKPNFFKPYVYTYFFGKRDYVLPTFKRAEKKDKTKVFFQTLYLNPYSRSTATWDIAFSKI